MTCNLSVAVVASALAVLTLSGCAAHNPMLFEPYWSQVASSNLS